MAGGRAAASLSLTIGIAFSTLLIAAGILAGPAIADCARQPDNIGKCLRAKVYDSGLVPTLPGVEPPTESSSEAVLISEPQQAPGWIEANATEYEPAAPSVVELVSTSAEVTTTAGPGIGPVDAGVMLDVPTGILGVQQPVAVPPQTTPAIALVETQGAIGAGGDMSGSSDAAALPILPRPNRTVETGASAPNAALMANVDAIAPGVEVPLATGSVGTAPLTSSVALEAGTLSAPVLIAGPPDIADPVVPEVADPPPPKPPLVEPAKPKTPKPAKPAAPKSKLRNDTRYPNVIVLPPPNTGDNSAIVTLQLR